MQLFKNKILKYTTLGLLTLGIGLGATGCKKPLPPCEADKGEIHYTLERRGKYDLMVSKSGESEKEFIDLNKDRDIEDGGDKGIQFVANGKEIYTKDMYKVVFDSGHTQKYTKENCDEAPESMECQLWEGSRKIYDELKQEYVDGLEYVLPHCPGL